MTLIFDLGGLGACGWCGSSSSICTSSLKFVGLAIRKIWRTMCVSINGPWPLTVWPWNWYASRIEGGEPSFQFWARQAFEFSDYRYVDDGRTDGHKQRIAPFLTERGIIRQAVQGTTSPAFLPINIHDIEISAMPGEHHWSINTFAHCRSCGFYYIFGSVMWMRPILR